MKASLIRSIYIILSSILVTAAVLITSFFFALFRRLPRSRTNSLIQKWARTILNIAKIKRARFEKTPFVPEPNRCYIVMCNHTSLYDIPITFDALPDLSIRMLAKKELALIPFFGISLRLNEFIFIDRKNKAKAYKDLTAAKKKLETGIVLWVAPEGTRSMNDQLLPFKKGIFHLAMDTEAIILPIYIKGASAVLPPKTLQFSLNQPVHVHIGTPIDSRLFNKADKKKLSDAVRENMLLLASADG